MPQVLVSNNSELLRHLAASAFRRLDLELLVAASGNEVLETMQRDDPALAILDVELPGITGYEVAGRIKKEYPACKVVLVMGKRISGEQMSRLAASGADELLIAPMSADELYDVVAIQLGAPRRGAERYTIDLAVVTDDGHHTIDGRVTNLSVDGARLVLPDPPQRPVDEQVRLHLTITPDDVDAAPIAVDARVVWAQHHDDGTVVGASFVDVTDDVRARLARLTQWEIVEETERTRVVLKGDFTEATSFDALLGAMVGRVDFDMSQVSYMNSLGVRTWCEFLRSAAIQGYEFHACSIPFVLQAAMVEGVLGRGTVTSFFAPYACDDCDHQEERLLQSAAVLASELDAPEFTCPRCNGKLELDDIPERYFAFLRNEEDEEE